jgi:hypothetical protein
MSELLKFVISGCLLYSMGGAKSPGLSSAEVRDAAQEQQWTASEGDEEMALFPSNAKATDDPIRYAPLRQQDFIGTRKRLFSQTCQSIWRSFPAAMEPATACGFVNLAYTYALLNNLVSMSKAQVVRPQCSDTALGRIGFCIVQDRRSWYHCPCEVQHNDRLGHNNADDI